MNDITASLINYTQGSYIMKRQLKARQKRQEKHFVNLKVVINQIPLTGQLWYVLIILRCLLRLAIIRFNLCKYNFQEKPY